MKPTYKKIAESFELWADYVDPDATMTKEDFEHMSTEEKVQMEIEIFGEEENEKEEE